MFRSIWPAESTICISIRRSKNSLQGRPGASNAFTSAFKDLEPIPQFRATEKLPSFLELATAGSN